MRSRFYAISEIISTYFIDFSALELILTVKDDSSRFFSCENFIVFLLHVFSSFQSILMFGYNIKTSQSSRIHAILDIISTYFFDFWALGLILAKNRWFQSIFRPQKPYWFFLVQVFCSFQSTLTFDWKIVLFKDQSILNYFRHHFDPFFRFLGIGVDSSQK